MSNFRIGIKDNLEPLFCAKCGEAIGYYEDEQELIIIVLCNNCAKKE